MKKFYLEYSDEEILPLAVEKLPWMHNIILIEKIKDKNIRKFMLKILKLKQKCIINVNKK